MLPEQRAAFIRRTVRAVLLRARVISLERLALKTAEDFARSETELAELLAREDLLETDWLRKVIAAEPLRPDDGRDRD